MADAGQGGSARDDRSRRREILDGLKTALPPSEAWNDWLERTGELPPDFATMPANPELPDLIPEHVRNATGDVASAWGEHRRVLKDQFSTWVLGTCPPAPETMNVEVVRERAEAGGTVRQLRLRFGAGASLSMELLIPPGDGPFPVFMTQHNHRDWATIAVRRGYIGCVYAGSDSQDDTDSFIDAYPGYDWSRLMRRAWAASRCVDYLTTLPEIKTDAIALAGHSRNGKQSIMAGAFDERIAAVIGSSPGAGGSVAARSVTEREFGEGIESLTRVFPDWFHPRLRFFAGREEYLPVDMHQMVGLLAPRACLLGSAISDPCEIAWAVQETLIANHELWQLLGAEESFHVLWRAGGHETTAETIELYLDWLDTRFGRAAFAFPASIPFPQDWATWSQASGRTVHDDADDLTAPGRQLLGTPPPAIAGGGGAYGTEPLSVAALLGRHAPIDGVVKHQVVMSEYISADLYLPEGAEERGERHPALLWLPPWPSTQGYHAAYRRGEQFYARAAREGFVVCCFDHIGSGRRVVEAERFYQRHPEWSLLGKMVRDGQSALNVLQTLPYVDSDRTWAVGYGIGSLVGLHVAALEPRVAGLVAIDLPAPLRRSSDQARRLSRGYMLIPALGRYEGCESTIPYDIDDLLGAVHPRRSLVVSAGVDRDSASVEVEAAIDRVRKLTKAPGSDDWLRHDTFERHYQLGPELQRHVLDWLRQQVGIDR